MSIDWSKVLDDAIAKSEWPNLHIADIDWRQALDDTIAKSKRSNLHFADVDWKTIKEKYIMEKKLQALEIQIEVAKKRYSKLSTEIRELTNVLNKKLDEQAVAILGEKPTAELESDIMRLQTQLAGMNKAHGKQAEILKSLGKDKETEMRSISLIQADQAKAESMALATNIYSLLSDCFMKLVELKAKNSEYSVALKGTGIDPVISESRKLRDLSLSLEKELPKLLPLFPPSVYADGKLPLPAHLNKLLKN